MTAFVDEPSRELRQGDVCYEWPFPLWNLNEFQITIDVKDETRQKAILKLHDHGNKVPVVVCSHDCEVENARNRHGLLVAPLLPWPFSSMQADESLELVASRTVDAEDNYGYINWFPLALGADGSEWRVVEFSAIMPMSPPDKIKPQLLDGKRFEMTEKTRTEFKEKLAMFFGR